MKCLKPVPLRVRNKKGELVEMMVPCGKCMACRINRTQEWSMRMMHESYFHDYNFFVTLTYSPEHLPQDFGLHKSDFQRWLKRLRKHLDYKIKYFACGEYGEQFGRPHYHAIIFGLMPDDVPLLSSCWQLGFVKVGTCTEYSTQYVSGYIQKKLIGKRAVEYGDREPPFQLVSQGLGYAYASANKEFYEQKGFSRYRGSNRQIPRYYKKKLALDLTDVYLSSVPHLLENGDVVLDEKGQVIPVCDLRDREQRERNLIAKLNLHRRKI